MPARSPLPRPRRRPPPPPPPPPPLPPDDDDFELLPPPPPILLSQPFHLLPVHLEDVEVDHVDAAPPPPPLPLRNPGKRRSLPPPPPPPPPLPPSDDDDDDDDLLLPPPPRLHPPIPVPPPCLAQASHICYLSWIAPNDVWTELEQRPKLCRLFTGKSPDLIRGVIRVLSPMIGTRTGGPRTRPNRLSKQSRVCLLWMRLQGFLDYKELSMFFHVSVSYISRELTYLHTVLDSAYNRIGQSTSTQARV